MPFLNEVLVANGTTSLGRVVYCRAVLDIILNDAVLTMAVTAGGTGYVVGENFELSTGTDVGGFVARGVVTAEAAGVVTAVKIISAGAYSADPTLVGGATSNASAGGNDDLTITVTMQTARWTLDTEDYVDDSTDFEWIATSVKATNPATIGMQSVTGSGNDSSRLMVASSFNNLASWETQPDSSPTAGMFLNIPGQNPELFLSTTERRVNIVARDGNNVQYGGMGLFIPHVNVDTAYPFPGIVHGQTTVVGSMAQQYNDSGVGGSNAGILHPSNFSTVAGASRYRDNLSTVWRTIARTALGAAVNAAMWPNEGYTNAWDLNFAPQLSGMNTNPFSSSSESGILSDASGNGSTGGWFVNAASNDGVQGVSPLGIGSQMSLVVTAHIISSEVDDTQVIGIIDGFENVHGIGLTAFEEIQSFLEASRYIVFPDTNTSVIRDWVAMEIV